MKVTVPYIDGPLHGITFQMEWMPEVSLCVDERDKRVFAYRRDEMSYFFDEKLSDKLTKAYDKVSQWTGRHHDIRPVDGDSQDMVE